MLCTACIGMGWVMSVAKSFQYAGFVDNPADLIRQKQRGMITHNEYSHGKGYR